MSVCSTIICTFLNLISLYIYGSKDFTFVVGGWVSLNACVTSICISLLFGFNQKLYDRLCKKCHDKCASKATGENKDGMDTSIQLQLQQQP